MISFNGDWLKQEKIINLQRGYEVGTESVLNNNAGYNQCPGQLPRNFHSRGHPIGFLFRNYAIRALGPSLH